MLSNKQKMLLHLVPAAMGIDEAQRRIIQQNVGAFFSAADRTASHEGFCAVMAFYEDRSDGKLDGFTQGYWRAAAEKNAAAVGGVATHRLLKRIGAEASTLGWTPADVNAFLASKHMSSGRHRRVQDATAYWLSRLLEALIQMGTRAASPKAGRAV